METLGLRSATALAGCLREGEVSSRELVEHYLERITTYDRGLGAVVTLDAERARQEADAADRRRARGEPLGVLDGLPITVKDQFATANMRTTYGWGPNRDFVPKSDATAVARLRDAGVIILGKTNLPALAGDVQSYNGIFGTTNNPWDLTRTPGGSSGGSAVAMSVGLSAMELGSDLAGSIRIPAAYCGVYGHKPSFGVVPFSYDPDARPGMRVEFCDMATAGPLARSAEDLDLALGVLIGAGRRRSPAWRLELPPPRGSLKAYRVAAWLDDPACPTDPEVLASLQAMVDELRGAGVEVDEHARPSISMKEAFRNFQKLMYGAIPFSLPYARWWPTRIPWLVTPPVPGDNQVSRVLRFGAQSHRDWILAHEQREGYRDEWASFFERYDVLLCPVSPVTAIAHNQHFGGAIVLRTMRASGARRRYIDQMMWPGLIGQAYLPATVAPIGLSERGLPVGVQIVGSYLEDCATIDFARRLADVCGGFQVPPGYDRDPSGLEAASLKGRLDVDDGTSSLAPTSALSVKGIPVPDPAGQASPLGN